MRFAQADVVVVGGGPAGICAAISAAEAGIEKVVLLESAGNLFGNSGQGFYALNSVLQQEVGIDISLKREMDDIMHFTSYLADCMLISKVLNESGPAVKWLIGHGIDVKLSEVPQQIKHVGDRVFHRWAHIPDRFARLKKAAEDLGVEIRFNTAVSTLVKDSRGGVAGVIAESKDGATVVLGAKAVVLATGGYINNPEMVSEAIGAIPARESIHGRSNMARVDGSGLRMAWDAGAGKRSERCLISHGVFSGVNKHVMDNYETDRVFLNIPILWVNQRGQRFCNEENIFDSTFFANHVRSQGHFAYSIADQTLVDMLKREGSPYEQAMWDIFCKNGSYFHGPLSSFDEDFSILEERRVAFRGDTVEELAEKMGADADTLSDTCISYNAMSGKGEDKQFFKSAKYLTTPVKSAPFYAFKGKVQSMSTAGGVRVDDGFRAISDDLNPVRGLYVIGADAGGFYGESYLHKEGFAMAVAFVSGIAVGASVKKNIDCDGGLT